MLSSASPLDGSSWLLLHFAFLGKERTADLAPLEFRAANDAILAYVFRMAANAGHLRIVFASSGAAKTPDASAYGACKLDHEERIAVWCERHGVPLVMPRIFNIGGPWINKVESYALSIFILAACGEGVIRINARRPTFRSYVHVNELLALLCNAALAQAPGEPLRFDTAGARPVEMADLASIVATRFAPRPIRIERGELSDTDADYYVGDGARYGALLTQQERKLAGLGHIVDDTAAFLRRCK